MPLSASTADGATTDLGDLHVAGIERILQNNYLAEAFPIAGEPIVGNDGPQQSKIGRTSREDSEGVEARRERHGAVQRNLAVARFERR